MKAGLDAPRPLLPALLIVIHNTPNRSSPFISATTSNPGGAFLRLLISVLSMTSFSLTFSTATNSFTASIFPAASGVCRWNTVCSRRCRPNATSVAFFDSGSAIADRRSVILKCVFGLSVEGEGMASGCAAEEDGRDEANVREAPHIARKEGQDGRGTTNLSMAVDIGEKGRSASALARNQSHCGSTCGLLVAFYFLRLSQSLP